MGLWHVPGLSSLRLDVGQKEKYVVYLDKWEFLRVEGVIPGDQSVLMKSGLW